MSNHAEKGVYMSDLEFQNYLKQFFDILGNKTVSDITKSDIQYQMKNTADDKAERKYLEVRKSLTKKQKKVVDKFIESRTATDNEYSVICYLAGMKDMIRILTYLKMI